MSQLKSENPEVRKRKGPERSQEWNKKDNSVQHLQSFWRCNILLSVFQHKEWCYLEAWKDTIRVPGVSLERFLIPGSTLDFINNLYLRPCKLIHSTRAVQMPTLLSSVSHILTTKTIMWLQIKGLL